MSSAKDTIYIDVDDEITSIIDKVESSKHDIVALVLPKRATALQSVVNMKLLQRASETSKKKLVLITSESALLPLAGIAGIHVAKSLQSKPVIPPAPDANPDTTDADEELSVDDDIDKSKAVGVLAAGAIAAGKDDDTETIAFDNDEDAPKPATEDKKAEKVKKNKKLVIPNFDKFRVGMVGGAVALVALIIFGYLALFVLPKATITITTDSTPVNATMVATTTAATQTLDEEKDILPAVLKESKKSDTAKVAATGSKDLGTKAGGEVTLALTDCSQETVSISAGTAVSTGGLNFITQAPVTLQRVLVGPVCRNADFPSFSTKTVAVIAQGPGENYNIAPSTFTVNGQSNVKGTSSVAMTGGTTKIAKVVSQQDIDKAKQQISDKNKTAEADFRKELTDQDLYLLEETFTTSEPKVTTTPALGEEASEVTVTQEVTYSVLTVTDEHISKLVKNELDKQIDKKTQKLKDGDVMADATVRVSDKKSTTEVKVTVQVDWLAVPIIDENQVKKDATGKKKGEIQSMMSNRPGVKQVDVSFSPFWVSKAPKESKITVISKPAGDN